MLQLQYYSCEYFKPSIEIQFSPEEEKQFKQSSECVKNQYKTHVEIMIILLTSAEEQHVINVT